MSHEQTDTRITAYIFGELSPEESAALEHELATSQELREELAAIRETLGALESEFETGSPDIGDSQRQAIEQAIHSASSDDRVSLKQSSGAVYRRWTVVAVVAASLLMVIGLAYPYRATLPGTVVSMNSAEESAPIVAEPETAAELKKQDAEFDSFSAIIALEGDEEEVETAAIDESLMTPVDAAPITYPDNRTWSDLSRRRVTKLGEVTTGLEDGLQSMDQSSPAGKDSGIVQPLKSRGSSNTENNFGRLPAETTARDFMMGEDPTGFGDFDMEPMNEGMSLSGGRDTNGLVDGYGLGTKPSQVQRESRRESRMEMDDMMDLDLEAGGVEMEEMMGMGGMMSAEGEMGGMEGYAGGIEMGMGGMGGGMEMDMGGMGMDVMKGAPQGDRFAPIQDNAFVKVRNEPLSTFSIDVDTASYAKVRSLLNQNSLPRPDAVRIEELLNYFSYDYPSPKDDHPFAASMEIATCPWSPEHRLARIGIKGRVIEDQRPAGNLVFLLDVSGSMDEPNKLPLVIQGMKMLTDQLTENDKVSIVVYAGAAGMVLDATRGDKKQQIVAALDRLKAGGSTNGGQGIVLAYQVARDNFIVGGTNRVILCSDGDFNVGVTGTDQLESIARENAKSKIFLSILGFGVGNHNDAMMERVSNNANGNYAFIDSKSEARKVLVEELGATLVAIAKDVKIQIEFNPQQVSSYRLIGYENRILAAEDFEKDEVDAGEIGAGHTVTALYEIVPSKANRRSRPDVDKLRYQQPITQNTAAADSGEMLVLKLRYQQPEGDKSTLMEIPVTDSGKKFSQTDRDFQFAASVAAFGMVLRNSPHKGNATLDGVARFAREGAKGDETGYRIEFLELVTKAKYLRGE